MTADQVAQIRNMRGCNVPWPIVAKTLKASILECRTAIGLPTYSTSERQGMPWDVVQRTLPYDN